MLIEERYWSRGWQLLLLALLAIMFGPVKPCAAASLPNLGEDRLADLRKLDLGAAFNAVATSIRFEPYAGALRSPAATAMASGGNSLDQARLLAEILTSQGYRVRFVRGSLEGENLMTIVRGMYPPLLPEYTTPVDYLPFDPMTDKELKKTASDHFWLELDQGDKNWLPLDPSFPRARIGEAYAKPLARFEKLPEELYQSITLTLHEETTDGKSRLLGEADGRSADLGLQPLSLVILGTPLMEAQEKPKSASGGDLFNQALSGDETKPDKEPKKTKAPARVGTRYHATLWRSGDATSMGTSVVIDAKPASKIRRQWLTMEIQAPGRSPRIVERDLYVYDAPGINGAPPALYRRYAVVVLPGALEPAAIVSFMRDAQVATDVKAARARVDAAAGTKAIEELTTVDDEIGVRSLHFTGLAIGAESSALTRRTGYNAGVTVVQALPRIIIVSLEDEADDKAAFRTAIDLRLDEVEAWPFPGRASRAVEHFQAARGLENSMLEAGYLQRLLGTDAAANTANLMSRVEGGQASMLAFSSGQQAKLDVVEGLSPYALRLIETTLNAGHEVIIPPKPVMLAGRARLGWWDRDPTTGRVIGVMDEGLHQAAEYVINTSEIGTNENTGMVIGAIVGATGTEILIAAKILENGVITPAIIAEIEKSLKDLQCLSCPEAEIKATAGASASGTCWKIEKKIEVGVGVKTTSFCEKYVKGMACASGLILNHLKGGSILGQTKEKTEISAGAKLPCQDDDDGGGAGGGGGGGSGGGSSGGGGASGGAL